MQARSVISMAGMFFSTCTPLKEQSQRSSVMALRSLRRISQVGERHGRIDARGAEAAAFFRLASDGCSFSNTKKIALPCGSSIMEKHSVPSSCTEGTGLLFPVEGSKRTAAAPFTRIVSGVRAPVGLQNNTCARLLGQNHERLQRCPRRGNRPAALEKKGGSRKEALVQFGVVERGESLRQAAADLRRKRRPTGRGCRLRLSFGLFGFSTEDGPTVLGELREQRSHTGIQREAWEMITAR